MLALELAEVELDFTELLRAATLFALECLVEECFAVECFAVDFFPVAAFAGALTTGSLDELAAEFALNCGAAKAAASDVVTRIFPKRFIIRFKPRTSLNCFCLAKLSFARLQRCQPVIVHSLSQSSARHIINDLYKASSSHLIRDHTSLAE
jgi:hypothetical protein